MTGGDIRVVMTLDDKDFSIKTTRATAIVDDMKKSLEQTANSAQTLENHFTSLGRKFHDTIFTVSLMRFAFRDIQDIFGAIPSAIIKTNAEMERMKTMLTGLTGSTKKAEDDFKSIFNIAQNAPTSVSAITDVFVKFRSVGLDPANGSVKSLIDGLAKFGGTSEQLKRAAIGIQQMVGKGVVSMEELRQQVGEALPNAMQAMATGLNMTMSQLAAAVKKGTLESKDALDRMFTVMRLQNQGASDEMMKTWAGLVAKLETRWTLFKDVIGKQGMFDTAKDELNKLVDAFGSRAMNDLATTVGSALASATTALVSLKETVTEYWSEIKIAGELMLYYFAGGRVMAGLEAMKAQMGGLMASYKANVAAKTLAWEVEQAQIRATMAAKAEQLSQEIALNGRAVALEREKNAAAATAAVAKMEAERQANAVRITELAGTLREMEAMESEYRMKRIAAELEAERLLRAKKAGTAAEARAMTAQADKLGGSEAIIAAEAQAQRTSIEALKAKNIEIEKNIVLTKAQGAALTTNQQALLAENAALLAAKRETEMASAAVKEMTLAQKSLNAVIAGGQMLWTALGGWVGLVTVAVTAGIYAWMNYKTAAEKAMEAAKRARDAERGIASDDQRKETEKEISNLKETVARMKADKANGGEQIMGAEGVIGVRQWTAKDDAELRKVEDQLKQAINTHSQQIKNILEANGNDQADAYRRSQERQKEEFNRSLTSKWAALKEAYDADVQQAGQNSAKQKAAGEKYLKAQQELLGDTEAKNLEFATKWRSDTTAKLQALVAVEGQRALTDQEKIEKDGLEKRQKQLTEEIRDMTTTQAQRLAHLKDAAVTIDNKNKGTHKMEHENPLVRALEQEQAQLEAAKVKLEALINETRGYEQFKSSAMFKVLGDVASGKFDTANRDADGKVTSTNKFGGSSGARQKYIEQLSDWLKKGKGTADEFIASLKTMDEQDKKTVLKMADLQAQQGQVAEMSKALADARQREAATLAELDAATTNYMTRGMAKETSGMQSLMKHFAQVEEKLKAGTKEFEEYRLTKQRALANQALADSRNYAADAEKELRDAKLKSISVVSERQAAEFLLEKQRIENDYAIRKRAIEDNVVDEIQRIAELDALNAARETRLTAATLNYAQTRKTELQRLSEEWTDVTQQMNKATANWSNGVIDAIMNFVKTGKFEWKSMLESMLTDVLKMQIQNTFGSQINGMMAKLGDALKNGLPGLMPQKQGGAADAVSGAASEAATKMTQSMLSSAAATDTAKMAMQTMTDTGVAKATEGLLTNALQTGISTSAEEMASSTLIEFVFAAQAATEALTQLAASSAADSAASFFADGGIMSSQGSLPLKMYSNGGIANSPQLAVFGEGRMNEAYVPLPDGRTIPVTMTGGGGGVGNVQVNVINQSGTQVAAKQGEPRFDGRQLILDVVLTAVNQPGSFRDGMKGALA